MAFNSDNLWRFYTSYVLVSPTAAKGQSVLSNRRLSRQRQENPRLKRFMLQQAQKMPTFEAEDWARYLLLQLWTEPEGTWAEEYRQCLFHYLQEACWYAALKVNETFQRSLALSSQITVEDCFMEACIAAWQPAELLKGFDLQAPSPVRVYAQKALTYIVKDGIVRQVRSKSIKLTDAGVLRMVGPNQLRTALQSYGLRSHPHLQQHQLAVQALQELFDSLSPPGKSGQPRLKFPLNPAQLSQLSQRCNQQQQRLGLEIPPTTPETMAQILHICVQAIRTHEIKPFIPFSALGDQSTNLVQAVPDRASHGWERVLETEHQQQIHQLRALIEQAFTTLEPLAQASLILWLGLKLPQTEFLELLQLRQQYEVARFFQRHCRQLLKIVMHTYLPDAQAKDVNQWCQDNLDIIKDCVRTYALSHLGDVLQASIAPLDASARQQLSHHGWITAAPPGLGRPSAETYLSKTDPEVALLVQVRQSFIRALEAHLQVSLQSFPSAPIAAMQFIKNWLADHPLP